MSSTQSEDTAPIIPELPTAERARIRALYITAAKEYRRHKADDLVYWYYYGIMASLQTVFGDDMFKDIQIDILP